MKNKKGKKLVVLGAMAALLTLIGVSGSQTYAKYIESAKVTSQSATVAKWGFVISANTEETLFGDAYEKAGEYSQVVPHASGVSAKAQSAGNDIVQPGGAGTFTFRVVGMAEVRSMVSFMIPTGWKDVCLNDGANSYNPIKWSLSYTDNKTSVSEDHLTDKTFKELADKLSDPLIVNEYPAGTDVDFQWTISWKWDFNNESNTLVKDLLTGPAEDVCTGNVADTYLGILATGPAGQSLQYSYAALAASNYNNVNTSTETSFAINMTIEQIQE